MILPIYTNNQPVLRQETEEIAAVTPEIVRLAADMRETMHNAEGVGLAAPQVGKPVALIVMEYADRKNPEESVPFTALANPKIVWKSKEKVFYDEGCLSLPGIEGPVRRPESVRVEALDMDGKSVTIEATDFFARVLQHEIDHLHGVLFTDYLKPGQASKRKAADYPRI